jgi:hypothetical protein
MLASDQVGGEMQPGLGILGSQHLMHSCALMGSQQMRNDHFLHLSAEGSPETIGVAGGAGTMHPEALKATPDKQEAGKIRNQGAPDATAPQPFKEVVISGLQVCTQSTSPSSNHTSVIPMTPSIARDATRLSAAPIVATAHAPSDGTMSEHVSSPSHVPPNTASSAPFTAPSSGTGPSVTASVAASVAAPSEDDVLHTVSEAAYLETKQALPTIAVEAPAGNTQLGNLSGTEQAPVTTPCLPDTNNKSSPDKARLAKRPLAITLPPRTALTHEPAAALDHIATAEGPSVDIADIGTNACNPTLKKIRLTAPEPSHFQNEVAAADPALLAAAGGTGDGSKLGPGGFFEPSVYAGCLPDYARPMSFAAVVRLVHMLLLSHMAVLGSTHDDVKQGLTDELERWKHQTEQREGLSEDDNIALNEMHPYLHVSCCMPLLA